MCFSLVSASSSFYHRSFSSLYRFLPDFVVFYRATVNWILKNGEVKSITEKVGMNLLEMAHKHGIDLEGACEASLACSTCHVIVEDPEVFDKTGDISDEENDMLDLAFGLTETYVRASPRNDIAISFSFSN